MKKILLLCAIFMIGGAVSLNAQSCCKKGKTAKSCDKSEARASATTMDEATLEAAVLAAEKDETIEKKVCEKSGKVSFVRLAVQEESSEVVATPVTFDASAAKFVAMPNDKKSGCCAKGEKKSCGDKKAEASSSKEEDAKSEVKKT